MPTYDVQCSECGYSGSVAMKIAALPNWDETAACPSCKLTKPQFRRVIRQAPASYGNAQTTKAMLASKKEQFVRSGARDTMRHDATKRVDRNQIEAARESVKRGEFES